MRRSRLTFYLGSVWRAYMYTVYVYIRNARTYTGTSKEHVEQACVNETDTYTYGMLL